MQNSIRDSLAKVNKSEQTGQEKTTRFQYTNIENKGGVNSLVVEEGIKELEDFIQYVMALIRIIDKVTINKFLNGKKDKIEYQLLNENIVSAPKMKNTDLIPIKKTVNNGKSIEYIMFLKSSDRVTLIWEAENVKGKYKIKDPTKTSKFFMYLPLIGTDKSFMPITVHSTDFLPEDDKRDNISLSKNESLIDETIELYKELVSECSKNIEQWDNIYNLIKITDRTQKKYVDQIGDIFNGDEEYKIIKVKNGSEFEYRALSEVLIFEKENQMLWKLYNQWEGVILPLKNEHGKWAESLSLYEKIQKVTILDLVKDINKCENLDKLLGKLCFGEERDVIQWLNSCYTLIKKDKVIEHDLSFNLLSYHSINRFNMKVTYFKLNIAWQFLKKAPVFLQKEHES